MPERKPDGQLRSRFRIVDTHASGQGTMNSVAAKKLWTAEELEKLSSAERTEIIQAGIVTDLSQVPKAFLERVHANVNDHIATTESATTTDR